MKQQDVEYNKQYWNDFYKNNHKLTPSQFCVCVLTELNENDGIVELGSGNGRDSLYFASQGLVTVAMDLSQQAIKSCQQQTNERNVKHASFYEGDITSYQDTETAISNIRKTVKDRRISFYSRFVMHSLSDSQEQQFISVLSRLVLPAERIYFEFRSQEDEYLDKHFGNHYRRYVNTEVFKTRLLTSGFEIEYELIGQGMAKYKEEDPYVARFIVRKKSNP